MTESSTDDDEEWKRRSIVARLEGKANLSVVERQELWQAKKESRATLMRQQEEAKARPSRRGTVRQAICGQKFRRMAH